MDELIKKINEQIEKFKYLEGTREKNIQTLNKRLKEIEEEKKVRQQNNK